MQSDHFIEVMALLNAIVRCFNDNIGKIDMNRLAQPLFAAPSYTNCDHEHDRSEKSLMRVSYGR